MKLETDLKELFARYLAGQASEDELLRLLDFFQQEEDSAVLRTMILAELENEEVLPVTAKQEAILGRVSLVLHQSIRCKKVHLRRLYLRWGAAAAAVLLIAGFWAGYNWIENNITFFSDAQQVVIVPGEDKAVLELEDGRVISLDSSSLGQDTKKAYVFADSNGMMTFNTENLASSDVKVGERTLRTPKGGQFAVILPDGTKVWLNAESSITFPTQFDQHIRAVNITGEAYFEVAKDQAKPFLVAVRQQTIKVLGTHFNVNAYPENDVVKTGLLEGSVAVIAGGKQVYLQPGQMSLWQEEGNGLKVDRIPDLENMLSWKEGMFSFDNSNIMEIMQILSRWYDVDFAFEKGDYSNCVFDGMISKKENIHQVLNILSASQQLSFEIKGKKVIVSQVNPAKN